MAVIRRLTITLVCLTAAWQISCDQEDVNEIYSPCDGYVREVNAQQGRLLIECPNSAGVGMFVLFSHLVLEENSPDSDKVLVSPGAYIHNGDVIAFEIPH